MEDPRRAEAIAILRRAPREVSRRASYGWEERSEQVVAHWSGGRRVPLAASRDERVSFALRDHYRAGVPTCREQFLALVAAHGAPRHVTVAWTHQAEWEGEAPLAVAGRQQFDWTEVQAILALGDDAPSAPSAILSEMNDETLRALERDVLERFLRYVRIDTQSRADSTSYPSSPGQLDLLRLLKDELRALGYADARLDEHGYVTATLPSTLPPGRPEPPVVAFFAHVDTAQDAPGKDVEPIVWPRYEGGTLTLPADRTQVLSSEESPPLAHKIGHDLVTSDGRTLLGADDKAGVAASMAAAAYLIQHPEVPHGVVKFAFNPDEEVGRGVDHFDLVAFGATYAYTLDAGEAGEVEDETFSADSATVRFHGRSAHPGYAKGKLINAIKVAADFVASLPRSELAPEVSEGRQGFVHPVAIRGAAEEATVQFIVRDFVTAELAPKEDLLRQLAEAAIARHPGARYVVEVKEQYRNMHEVLARHPRVVALADEAVRRVGLEPIHRPIRGGTDGSRLCQMGLPTPNIFAGWQMIHSRREWVSVQDMGKASRVVIELAKLWAEQGASEP